MLNFLYLLTYERPGLIDFDWYDLYHCVFKKSKIVSIINATNKDDINLIKISDEMPTRGLLCLCENKTIIKGMEEKLASILSKFNYNLEVRSDLIYTIRDDDYRIFGIFTKDDGVEDDTQFDKYWQNLSRD